MRNWVGALKWYDENQRTSQIGFNPDGMCLMVCRTARDIPARYPTAVAAQEATPKEHRVYDVKDLRKGMVLYFDDPNDSNRFGHIVTMVGRVAGYRPDSLDDVLVETNSVKKGELVVVRASYFKTHWGDAFKFGATWLNGFELDHYQSLNERRATDDRTNRVERFWEKRTPWDLKLLDAAITKGGRNELRPKVKALHEAAESVPDLKNEDVQAFKEAYDKHNVLKTGELRQAINKDPRMVRVKDALHKMNTIIKSLPRH